jgi:hypothetical protein
MPQALDDATAIALLNNARRNAPSRTTPFTFSVTHHAEGKFGKHGELADGGFS